MRINDICKKNKNKKFSKIRSWGGGGFKDTFVHMLDSSVSEIVIIKTHSIVVALSNCVGTCSVSVVRIKVAGGTAWRLVSHHV